MELVLPAVKVLIPVQEGIGKLKHLGLEWLMTCLSYSGKKNKDKNG
jgi:hypothetical protein